MSYGRTLKTRDAFLAVALLSISLGGCIYEVGLPASGDRTFAPLNPIEGMHVQPSAKDQSYQQMYRADQPVGMRMPPPGTLPTDFAGRDEFATPAESARLANPVPITEDSLTYGQFLYDTHCSVCHGMAGHGDGSIVEAGHFGAPPTLNSANLRSAEDGRIYHIITYGQNSMWPYKNNLKEMERWALVHYVRALQRADMPEPADLDRMRQQ